MVYPLSLFPPPYPRSYLPSLPPFLPLSLSLFLFLSLSLTAPSLFLLLLFSEKLKVIGE